MTIIEKIAREKINQAIASGEFDNLPGKGKPLVFDEDLEIPQHLRMAFKILKNANILPEEVQLKKDMHVLRQRLATTPHELERRDLRRKIGDLETRFNLLMENHRRQLAK